MTDSNPLLHRGTSVPFHLITPAHVVPAVRAVLAEAETRVHALSAGTGAGQGAGTGAGTGTGTSSGTSEGDRPDSWDSTIGELDSIVERVRRVTTPVHHLLAVSESRELRDAWNEVLADITTFWSRLYLNQGVHDRILAWSRTEAAQALSPLHSRHLERTLRAFERSGAGLSGEARARLEALEVELSQLEQTFSEHVLDATAAWSLRIEDESRLRGIPDDARARFRELAESRGEEGWTLTLDAPTVQAVLKSAGDRSLREEVHTAYLARGTEAPWDNRPLIPRILGLRREKAMLLGYRDFPDYRLEEQMARDGATAREFLEEMVKRTRPYWQRDWGELEAEARTLGLGDLRPWDTSWVAERIRITRFDLDEEELRPYFPLESVMQGLFELAHRLFGLRIQAETTEATWHPDVRYYAIFDEAGTRRAAFYADLFPRPEKRQGAWMSDFIYGGPTDDGGWTPHLANICGNFPPPGQGRPALLTHRDVETLFHEFGHLLHHCTSTVPLEGRGGINVAWDWVELPSQLMENWTWEEEALAFISGHWETGESVPSELFRKMLRARRFLGGWMQMRQLSFGIMDMALHGEYDPDSGDEAVEWATARVEALSPTPEFAGAHPLPSFLHLFSGGYAASYYAYLWSEVLEADLFSRFRDEGLFSRAVGEAYLQTILSQGDSKDPDLLFRDFMGRDPDPEPLLRRNLGELPEVSAF